MSLIHIQRRSAVPEGSPGQNPETEEHLQNPLKLGQQLR
jgi:hypothetical protein